MSFRLAIILASLAYASAGYLQPATPYPAALLAAPALSYGHGHSSPVHPLVYSAPITHNYAVPALPAYSTPAVAYNNHYGHPAYATSLATKAVVAIAQPTLEYAQALPHAHNYAPAISYNNIGYSSYVAPLAVKSVAVADPAPIAHSVPLLAARATALQQLKTRVVRSAVSE